MLVGHETARNHRVAERRVCAGAEQLQCDVIGRHHQVAERRGCAGAVLQQCDVFGRQLNGKAAPELLTWINVALASVFFVPTRHTFTLFIFVLFDDHEGITTPSSGRAALRGESGCSPRKAPPWAATQRGQRGHRCCRSGEWERALKTHATISLFLLSGSLRISTTGCFFGLGALVFEKVLSCETRGPIQRNRGPIQRNTVSLNRTAHE